VANYYLNDIELPNEFREAIQSNIVLVHTSVQEYSKEFEIQLKRKTFSTPKNYLDFLNNYKILLNDNRKKFNSMAKRCENGLIKLEQAADQVEIL